MILETRINLSKVENLFFIWASNLINEKVSTRLQFNTIQNNISIY